MQYFFKSKVLVNSIEHKRTIISTWLTCCLSLIILIIFIGGLTRLTGSGLSIVEWKPITGIVPPINLQEWEKEFNKYKASAEYNYLNNCMKINEFKFIYFIEYFHRLLGRVIAIVFLIPLVYFLYKNFINNRAKFYLFLAAFMIILQGAVGWYMVKSGLVDSPHISHYKLALHLMMAVVIYSLLFWQLMSNKQELLLIIKNQDLGFCKIICLISLIITYLQIILGALLAGVKGGHVYNSFPLMGDHFISSEIMHRSLSELMLFNDPVFIQFVHRINSYFLVLSIIILAYNLLKTGINKLKKIGITIFFITVIQVTLGILTLLYSVPITLALLHQLCSMLLLSYLLRCYFFLINS